MIPKRISEMSVAELQAVLPELARGIQNHCSIIGVKDPKFVLLLFDEPSVNQQVTNVKPEIILEVLKGALDRNNRAIAQQLYNDLVIKTHNPPKLQ